MSKIMTRLFFNISLFLIAIGIAGCEKESLKWNLDRDGFVDAKSNTKNQRIAYYNCEDANGFSFNVTGGGNSSEWLISQGFTGNGFVTNYSSGGSLGFYIQFNTDVVMSFWTQTKDPGFPNRTPIVKINNQTINSVIIDGSEDDWMKIQTSTILKGDYNISIEFVQKQTFASLFIDEIEFWGK